MKNKNFVIFMMILAMLFMSNTTCYAKSFEMFFNLKSGETKTGFAAKKSEANFEKKFYVRHIDCEPSNASFRTQTYHAILGTSVASNPISMSATSTDRKSNTYLSGKAKANKTYKLRCKSTSSIHKNEVIGVSGKWTP
ncbi:hypothetical protein [Eubacterium sp. An3]|uniref:hypothetical protein n=1 Tax=Eubacterium sp. An3 TaxID=1965628 RepID=UPI000B379885|nr:hypothetical protein [Eubacterium sp. An3]OUO24847.1 hypothetical protein B5F87_18990 [Eubacterium sp. An3]